MSQSVSAIASNYAQTEEIVASLQAEGFSSSSISVLIPNANGQYAPSNAAASRSNRSINLNPNQNPTQSASQQSASQQSANQQNANQQNANQQNANQQNVGQQNVGQQNVGQRSAQNASRGAAGNTQAGGVSALSATRELEIPGLGEIVAAGPIANALNRAANNIAESLASLGFSQSEAARCERELRSGNCVIAIQASNAAEQNRARAICEGAEAAAADAGQ